MPRRWVQHWQSAAQIRTDFKVKSAAACHPPVRLQRSALWLRRSFFTAVPYGEKSPAHPVYSGLFADFFQSPSGTDLFNLQSRVSVTVKIEPHRYNCELVGLLKKVRLPREQTWTTKKSPSFRTLRRAFGRTCVWVVAVTPAGIPMVPADLNRN